MKWRYIVMKKRVLSVLLASVLAAGVLAGCGSNSETDTADTATADKVTITNVSYDPTRELYQAYNELFAEHWKEQTGQDVEITQSHGGSGKQALEVANGLEADVVTLALEYDVKAVQDAGLIEDGWVDEFDLDSSPYTSTIVFLVRKGNPKNIQDWDDLVKDGVGVITPNPKTSGGARWNYLAAWAYADKLYNGDEEQIKEFVKKLYQNVLVLDSGARGATTSFVENEQGDVLIAWENEAYLSIQDHPDDYEIVTPSISILAQPSVAVVDAVVDKRGTREVATEYLNYLYSDEAQKIAGDNFYRPSNQEILQQYADTFDLNINLVTIKDFGGWDAAQEKHFADGGVFDEIYEQK
jgi:sulfate transport system substrate-binding protein